MRKFLGMLTICGFFFTASFVHAEDQDTAVKRGAYLARLGDCIACHTAPGRKDFSGGLPMNSPFGVIYSTNITPDPTYGIGAYSEEDFGRALRQGIAKDGHHLYPAMPYPSFSIVNDQNIHDLYLYFMHGVAAVDDQPPQTNLPFPLNQRWGLVFWNWAFSRHRDFKPVGSQSSEWNRGAYIVQGLAHCGACHTPRTVFYNEYSYDQKSSSYLSSYTVDNWHAANLRGGEIHGLGAWSEDDLASFLKSGWGHGATAFGSMQQVVEDSAQYYNDDDMRATVRYLKSLASSDKNDNNSNVMIQPAQAMDSYPIEHPGAGLYASLCARCHGPEGEGYLHRVPALAGNPIIVAQNPISLIHIVLEGGKTASTQSGIHTTGMPAFPNLTDREISEVLSYIRSSWGNRAAAVSMGDVASLRATLNHDNQVKQQAP